MLALPQPSLYPANGRTLYPRVSGSNRDAEFRAAESIARDLRTAGLIATWQHVRIENALHVMRVLERGLPLADLRIATDYDFRNTVSVSLPPARWIEARAVQRHCILSSEKPICLLPPPRLALPAPRPVSTDALAAAGIAAQLVEQMACYAQGGIDEASLRRAFVDAFKTARGLGSAATRPTPIRFNRRAVESQFGL